MSCNRCQRTYEELPSEDGSKLWKIKWTIEGSPIEILCGQCLDMRDEWLQQITNHYVNYEAPEAVCDVCTHTEEESADGEIHHVVKITTEETLHLCYDCIETMTKDQTAILFALVHPH